MALTLLFCAFACTDSGTRTFRIGTHTFVVPVRYLVRGTIPWLPASQSRGINFVLNPDDKLPDQIFVDAEIASDICRPDLAMAQSEAVKQTCSATMKKAAPERGEPQPLRKTYPDPKDHTQWSYYATAANSRSEEVAYCTPGTTEGLCNFVGHYSDVFYTVGFGERRISHVFELRRRVEGLLADWEKT